MKGKGKGKDVILPLKHIGVFSEKGAYSCSNAGLF